MPTVHGETLQPGVRPAARTARSTSTADRWRQVPGIDELLAPVRRRGGVKVGPRAEARVHKAALAQLKARECLGIGFVAIMLEVRPLVPEEAQGLEITLDLIDVGGLRALAVEILDAQHHAAALGLRHEPCDERGVDVARVHAPGRRRREAADDGCRLCRAAFRHSQ